jgi:hypothetical protein
MTQTVEAKAQASLNKFEKLKAEKDGLALKAELDHFAEIGWEAMDETIATTASNGWASSFGQ